MGEEEEPDVGVVITAGICNFNGVTERGKSGFGGLVAVPSVETLGSLVVTPAWLGSMVMLSDRARDTGFVEKSSLSAVFPSSVSSRTVVASAGTTGCCVASSSVVFVSLASIFGWCALYLLSEERE